MGLIFSLIKKLRPDAQPLKTWIKWVPLQD